MTYRTSTLATYEPTGLTKKGDAKLEENVLEEIQAHIDMHTNVGWKLHSFTSVPGAFISTMNHYTHRHFFVWESGD